MSEIDSYKHRCLGIVACPSRYPIMSGNDTQRLVPIYRLDEDVVDDETGFQGKLGDVLLGGGLGESAALRISLPEAFYFFTREDWEHFPGSEAWIPEVIVKAYWSMTRAYVFGDGYSAVGWTPDKPIELWLMEHILSFLVQHYPAGYAQYLGSEPLEEDGSICRLPTADELLL